MRSITWCVVAVVAIASGCAATQAGSDEHAAAPAGTVRNSPSKLMATDPVCYEKTAKKVADLVVKGVECPGVTYATWPRNREPSRADVATGGRLYKVSVGTTEDTHEPFLRVEVGREAFIDYGIVGSFTSVGVGPGTWFNNCPENSDFQRRYERALDEILDHYRQNSRPEAW